MKVTTTMGLKHLLMLQGTMPNCNRSKIYSLRESCILAEQKQISGAKFGTKTLLGHRMIFYSSLAGCSSFTQVKAPAADARRLKQQQRQERLILSLRGSGYIISYNVFITKISVNAKVVPRNSKTRAIKLHGTLCTKRVFVRGFNWLLLLI